VWLLFIAIFSRFWLTTQHSRVEKKDRSDCFLFQIDLFFLKCASVELESVLYDLVAFFFKKKNFIEIEKD